MKDFPAILSTDAPAIISALLPLVNLFELREGTRDLIRTGIQAQRLLNAVADDIELVEYLEVHSDETLAEAQRIAGRLASVCSDTGSLEKERLALTAPWNDLAKAINAGYKPAREYVQAPLAVVNGKIRAYDALLRQQAAEREAAERKRRQEAADAAAALEAKAKAEAEALLKRAEEAQGGGATATAVILAVEASQVLDAGRQAVQAAQVAMAAPSASFGAARVKGTGEAWDAEVTSLENLITAVAAGIAKGDGSLVSLLMVNASAVKAKAKLEKERFNVPGLRATCASTLRIRKVAV